ncbi:hypothetical protein F5X68DRAFT_218561 [Plectosphaerella plurivora]|uniref:Heterokaryon incompatibility domain-containing protein n=1 Tax=Plectosphaerella plurivora TaxID=936078 RepID=A0A9P9A4N3_9PEZI|nr:hypothetical protein F5X68DRAFT_218561 [Plectosphaerella plurivora]
MRLINVETRQLESFFFSGDVPPYAILSHTWGADEEEITFQDFQSGNTTKPGIGRFKLDESCKQAKNDGLFYIWNDTCCIDKSNSSELGEAINSMFKWYKKSDRCYAYLQDVPHDQIGLFPKSRWFTRGWTLQELLAPEEVMFFSSEWRLLGSCKELAPQVENATGIPQHYLMGIADISEASVAQRMSWAATRQTKRPEDIAYSLLGIFGIVMSMIYGEGEEAFMRLQEEIMRRKIDDSILAWGLEQTEGGEHRPVHSKRGGLASSPANFKNCGLIVSGEFSTTSFESFNTLGPKVRIRLPLYKTPSGHTFGLLGSHLNHDHTRIVGIPLSVVEPESSNTYVRPQKVPARIFNSIECIGSTIATINVLNKNSDHPASQRRHGFFITDQTGHGLEIIRVHPGEQWQQGKSTISALLDPETGLVKTQRTWVRMRCKDASFTEHLILVLDLNGSQDNSSAPTPHCTLMVGDADQLSAWDDETGHSNIGAFEKISYRGGNDITMSTKKVLQADVALERVGAQPMFVVRIGVAVGKLPTQAPSWDTAMRIHAITFQLARNVKSQDTTLTLQSLTISKLNELRREVEPLRRQLSSVEYQIKTLEAEKERLMSHIASHDTEISMFAEETTKIEDTTRKTRSKDKALLDEWATSLGGKLTDSDDRSRWRQDEVARRLLDDLPEDIQPQHGFSLSGSSPLCEKLLTRAVLHGNPGIAAFAMDTLGAEAKSIFLFREHESTSLFEIAAAYYSPAVVQTLLDRETYMEPEAAVICSVAAKHGNLEVVKAIYYSANLGPNILSLCLTQALEGTRHLPTVQFLLEKGADANIPNFFPLHLAAESDDVELLTLLLDNGTRIATEDRRGLTPIAKAAAYSKECTKLLLARGADPDHGTARFGVPVQKPLYMAALSGRVDTAQMLLDAGADIEAVASNGRRALACAAELGHFKVVALLLDRGADVHAHSNSQHMALNLAASLGHLETVRVMCEHHSSQTALFATARAAAVTCARKAGQQDIVDYLRRENRATQAPDLGDSRTPTLQSGGTEQLPRGWAARPQELDGRLLSQEEAERRRNALPPFPASSTYCPKDSSPADQTVVASPTGTQARVEHDDTDCAAGKRPIVIDEWGVPRRDEKETEELLRPFKPPPSPPPRNSMHSLGSVISRIVRR